MILRKPYALLIKYFRLIHIVITLLVIFLAYKTNSLYRFLAGYVKTNQLEVVGNITGEYFNYFMFLSIVLILFMNVVIGFIMRLKKKPIFFYIVNSVIYVLLIVIYSYSSSVFSSIEMGYLDTRILRALRDVLLISFIVQFLSVILYVVRATGFDVKKFNFVKDLAEIEIEESDNEEVEVSVDLGLDVKKRNLKRILRNIKYTYVENRFMFNVGISLVLVIVSTLVFLSFLTDDKYYKKGVTFYPEKYSVTINESYLTDKDYKGNVINKDKQYVIVEGSFKSYSKSEVLNKALIPILVDDKYYYPTNKYIEEFSDLGKVYSIDKFNNKDESNYLLVYEIPKEIKSKDIKLVYLNQTYYGSLDAKKMIVNLDYIKLDEENKIIEEQVKGVSVDLNTRIYDSKTFVIDYFEIQNIFELSVIKKHNNRYLFLKKVIIPKLKNREQMILKIGVYKGHNIEYNLEKTLKYYGNLYYEYNNKMIKTNLELIESYDNSSYYSVDKNIVESNKIYIEIKFRNKNVIYKLKG